MKTRYLLTTAALLLACAIISAQSYTIRVSSNANLRSFNSLRARIVETAPAGSTLTVLGEVNRWLRISRGEGDVWMADWVRHERVEDGAQSPTQAVSDVDNCCFVDRHCNADQDWTDGYWAFQNGQCAASAKAQQMTAAAGASMAVDNCCFVDRQCNTDIDWKDGYWAFQANQCGASGQSHAQLSAQHGVNGGQTNNCCQNGWQCNSDADWLEGYIAFQENRCNHRGVAIEGSTKFIARVEAALDLLKARAPHWYEYAVAGLKRIREVASIEGAFVYVGSATAGIAPGQAYIDEFLGKSVERAIIWVAAIIVHDSCHVHLFRAGQVYSGLEGERACLITQIEAMDDFNAGDAKQFGMRGLLANINKVEYQWWHLRRHKNAE